MGRCVNKSGVFLDNKYVVPNTPYLLLWYNVHINVEICSSVQSCKYCTNMCTNDQIWHLWQLKHWEKMMK